MNTEGCSSSATCESDTEKECESEIVICPKLLDVLKLACKEHSQSMSTVDKCASYRGKNLEFMASVFFNAATKLSDDHEDILPQEDSENLKLSVYHVFCGLFPAEDRSEETHKRCRLHFNKVGYNMYGKEQSRRVPALRAKPGNPGYGFRRARWRDTIVDGLDAAHCEAVLRSAGFDDSTIGRVRARVQEVADRWNAVRRPSRPAGPGRPRRGINGDRRPDDLGRRRKRCRAEPPPPCLSGAVLGLQSLAERSSMLGTATDANAFSQVRDPNLHKAGEEAARALDSFQPAASPPLVLSAMDACAHSRSGGENSSTPPAAGRPLAIVNGLHAHSAASSPTNSCGITTAAAAASRWGKDGAAAGMLWLWPVGVPRGWGALLESSEVKGGMHGPMEEEEGSAASGGLALLDLLAAVACRLSPQQLQ